MPQGIFITVTHTGLIPSAILLADIYPTTDGHTAFVRSGPVYVPFGGSIILTYSDTVSLSFEGGNIRKFVEAGYLTAVLSLGGSGVTFPPSSGDVSGTYPNLTVTGIQGFPIQNAGGPNNGDSLIYNSLTGLWEHSPIVFGGGPPVGPAGGDLGGLYPNPGVTGLQARPIDPVAPNLNDALVWDGAKWTPTPVGSALQAVYGSFSDSSDQPFVPGDVLVVKYDTVEAANGVSVANDPLTLRPTRITVSQAGVYAFTLSPQILHTGGGTEIITFWMRQSGVGNVPNSASSFEMGNNNNRVLPFIEVILSMSAGQYVEWAFTASTGTNVSLEHFGAVVGPPAIPAIPSVIAGVKRLGS